MNDYILPRLLPSFILSDKHGSSCAGITDYTDASRRYFLVASYNGADDHRFYFYRYSEIGGSEVSVQPDLLFSCPTPHYDYESIALLTDTDNNIFMVGFWSKEKDRVWTPWTGTQPLGFEDHIDLIKVGLKSQKLTLLSDRHITTHYDYNGPSSVGVHCRFGAGLSILTADYGSILVTERVFDSCNILSDSIGALQINTFVPARVVPLGSRPVIYEHGNYGGRSQELGAGRYDITQTSLGNDTISSVKVPAGWRVTLYQHGGFTGSYKVLTADTPNLPDFNDQASSIVVEEDL